MLVLVTRPQRDAERLAQLLRRNGHATMLAPMLTIGIDQAPDWPAQEPAALAVTSANGIDALHQHKHEFNRKFGCDLMTKPIFAVGKKTAQAARRAGWLSIETAAGDVSSLADLILQARPQGCVWHASGEAQSGDLVTTLRRAKIDALRVKLYHAQKTQTLPPHVAKNFHQIAGVVLYSLRSAEAFIDLLPGESHRPVAFCLSDKIAIKMAQHGFATAIAAKPDDRSMIAIINDWAKR